MRSIGRYILVGLITAAPLAITWLVLDFLFSQLSRMGWPLTLALATALSPRHPELADWLLEEHLQSAIAAVLVLALLYVLGWATTRVLGQRLIQGFESLVSKIPLVQTIYKATKRFLTVANPKDDERRRVVLISFPNRDMKTIGFLTRILRDSGTGEELAAVYVPTAPNPTSGYIEIVRLRDVTMTDWSFDQAIAFVVTGGTSAPDEISFSESSTAETRLD